MAIRHVTVSGRADPSVVWERFLRFELWPQWSPQIRAVESADPGLRLGATGRVVAVGGIPIAFTVTGFDDPGRSWSWIVRIGLLTMTMHHVVTATEGGCRVGMILDGPGWFTAAYAPLMAVALRRLVNRRPLVKNVR
jgi:hypothetical protein